MLRVCALLMLTLSLYNMVSILYQNVRGLRTKSEEFASSILGLDYSLICITETWLSSAHTSAEFAPADFILHRRDRCAENGLVRGGGAAILIRKGIKCRRRFDLDVGFCWDSVWLDLPDINGNTILVGCVYVAPQTSVQDFSDSLTLLESQLLCLDNVFLIGDFNLPGINWDAPHCSNINHYYIKLKANKFIETINRLNYQQYNREQNFKGNILDLVLCNRQNVTVKPSDYTLVNVDPFHPPLHVYIDMPRMSRFVAPPFLCLDYRLGDYDKLAHEILSRDWTDIYCERDVNRAVATLTATVSAAIQRCIPSCVRRPHNGALWVSKITRRLTQLKRVAHRRYKRSLSSEDYNSFAKLRLQLKRALKNDKVLHCFNLEQAVSNKPRRFWHHIANRDFSEPMSIKTSSGVVVSDPALVVEEFRKTFAASFVKTDPRFRSPTGPPVVPLNYPTFDLLPFSVEEVQQAIRESRPKFSAGSDGIPSFILKGVGDALAPPLAHIFNLSIESGVFPDEWKMALVVPVPKKGDRCLPGNYRPISLLNCFCKIFERMVYNTIIRSIVLRLSDAQHGFLQGRSTVTNLVSFLSSIAPTVEKSGQVDAIYFDLAKAFDSVNHSILFSKLEAIGLSVRGVAWFRSYLTGRNFRVKSGEVLSRPSPITSGVVQGSVLGPLLFAVFINDLPRVVSKQASILLFADDIKLFRRVQSRECCISLQTDVDAVCAWLDENSLSVNSKKTKLVSFTRKTAPVLFKYTANGVVIMRQSSVVDLGITLDADLRFRSCVSDLVAAADRAFGAIVWAARNFSNPSTVLLLYRALVRSRLEYGSVVWGSLTATDQKRIEAVQNRFLMYLKKWVDGVPHLGSVSPLRVRFGLPTLVERRKNADILFLGGLLSGETGTPDIIGNVGLRAPRSGLRGSGVLAVSYSEASVHPLSRLARVGNDAPADIDLFVGRKELRRLLRNRGAVCPPV